MVLGVQGAPDPVHNDGPPHGSPLVDGNSPSDQLLGLPAHQEVAGPGEPHHHLLPPRLHLLQAQLRLGQVLLGDPLQSLRLLYQTGPLIEPEAKPVVLRCVGVQCRLLWVVHDVLEEEPDHLLPAGRDHHLGVVELVQEEEILWLDLVELGLPVTGLQEQFLFSVQSYGRVREAKEKSDILAVKFLIFECCSVPPRNSALLS